MIEVGLWIQTQTEKGTDVFLIKKDPLGHPTLSALQSDASLEGTSAKKEKLRELYEGLTGQSHPHPHATSRQLMWDFLEAAMKQLP